ncbi:lambda-crystallin [Biomphalaria pfeifferi]|uniref:Lambda-crystallin n=1 Tax=Biomphalaria pfeifferi TaxID=112525 RepID=A0AAD8AUP9_BIOPF|nr:lambda-crystallin [Biomphalaria pfeifferi]
MSSQKIGVIGSGLIGRSFTMLFVSAGYKVVVFDIEQSQLEAAKKDIWKQLVALESQGLLRGKLTKEQQFENITTTSDLKECILGSFFIQECVPEILELKRKVWREVDSLIDAQTIMSSSTSALLPSAISEGLKHKNRFIVSHPTNPPFYAPATEVVPARWTDPEVTERTFALLKEVGQVPVLIKKEVDGFVLNRIQYAIMGECYRLIRDGVVSPQDCDLIMSQGLGVRYAFMGPFETAYLNAEGMYSYRDRYADMILGIQQSFGPPERMDGPTLDLIQQDIAKVAGPVEDIGTRRQWRDKRLIALAKLKRDMDKSE